MKTKIDVVRGPRVKAEGIMQLPSSVDIKSAVAGVANDGWDQVFIEVGPHREKYVIYGRGLNTNVLQKGTLVRVNRQLGEVVAVDSEINTAWEGAKAGWGGLAAAAGGLIVGVPGGVLAYISGMEAGVGGGGLVFGMSCATASAIGWSAVGVGALALLGGVGYTGYKTYQGAAVKTSNDAMNSLMTPAAELSK